MVLINKDNRDWAQSYEDYLLSKDSESLKNKVHHTGSFFFMDYPAPDTKNETQN
jgi:hypothetical protein